MKHYYLAIFYIQKQGYKYFAINLEAKNAKEAKQALINKFMTDYCKDLPYTKIPHMFKIDIKRLKAGDEFLYHYFTRISQEEFWKLNRK